MECFIKNNAAIKKSSTELVSWWKKNFAILIKDAGLWPGSLHFLGMPQVWWKKDRLGTQRD